MQNSWGILFVQKRIIWKEQLKEDLKNKDNKDVERQIERYSPVFVEPIKTKKS